MGREGQALELLTDFSSWDIMAGPVEEDQTYGKVWLLPYQTGKDPSQVHNEGYIWYDELIISTQDIADPGAGSAIGGVAPVAPSSLQLR
jgi:hypothetical protein